jgi:hypothetical protein
VPAADPHRSWKLIETSELQRDLLKFRRSLQSRVAIRIGAMAL